MTRERQEAVHVRLLDLRFAALDAGNCQLRAPPLDHLFVALRIDGFALSGLQAEALQQRQQRPPITSMVRVQLEPMFDEGCSGGIGDQAWLQPVAAVLISIASPLAML